MSVGSYYLSPERAEQNFLINQIELIKATKLIQNMIDASPDTVFILNSYRQLVACNIVALKLFSANSIYDIIGKRFGEALNCIHAFECAGGCGTSIYCLECGAAKAIDYTGKFFKPTEEECRIIANQDEVENFFEVKVFSKILEFENQKFMIVTLKDITDEKRREALEKIFFHDLLNTINAARGVAEILSDLETKKEREELTSLLMFSIDQLAEEIAAQRQLSNAEKGNLEVQLKSENVYQIFENVKKLYKVKIEEKQLKVTIDNFNKEINVIADYHLLLRSLGNLLKNAIEACLPGEEIKFMLEEDEYDITLKIANPGKLPTQVRSQLFKRSFSTKSSKGRGLGLYSVKLIVEKFMNGKVYFKQDKVHGVVFNIKITKNKSNSLNE